LRAGDYVASSSPTTVTATGPSGQNILSAGIALALKQDVTVNATPLIATSNVPNASITGNADVSVDPLILTGTLPNATITANDSIWSESNKSTTTWTETNKS
jgi:hypothetical protein